MADGVARSPSRFCSRDGKINCYGDALSTIFLLALKILCLASYFSIFVFLFLFFFPASRYVYLPRVPSSVQQPSATPSKYVFYITCSFCSCHLYPTPSGNCFVFLFVQFFFVFFSQLLFLGWRFCCCALALGTLALGLPTLILQHLVFLCLTVTTELVRDSLG